MVAVSLTMRVSIGALNTEAADVDAVWQAMRHAAEQR
jgi:hypothetical protein